MPQQREREISMVELHDEDDDREMPDPSDQDDDDSDGASTDTIDCPSCGREVYEQAERCPNCGSYISRDAAVRRRPPLWIIAGVVICLLIVIVWTLR
jgi:predicted RNA-binding Zn-ribbon protein involved in translation (DUF1610 family)